jgi:hypothetical protein
MVSIIRATKRIPNPAPLAIGLLPGGGASYIGGESLPNRRIHGEHIPFSSVGAPKVSNSVPLRQNIVLAL